MQRVSIKVEDSSDGPVKVGDRVVAVSETITLEVTEGLTISKAEPETNLAGAAAGPLDVFDPANRPNGNMSAQIAPKLPKSGGETSQVDEGGRVVERQVAELGVATQGGGPESKDGSTPGPQPEPVLPQNPGSGAATGDIDASGKPLAASESAAQPQRAKPGPKAKARSAGTTAAKRSGAKGRR